MTAARLRRALAALSALGALTFGQSAAAFCQTTTCDPELNCVQAPEECCIPDARGCDTNGTIVGWPSLCVSYAVNETASPVRDIDFPTFDDIVTRSMEKWVDVTCDGEPPLLELSNYGPSACAVRDIDPAGKNANVWLFRDDGWPYAEGDVDEASVDAAALALTVVSFNPETGELYDADVELNSTAASFTTGDDVVGIDLEAIITHEAGHFLGLDHSDEPTSTMYARYRPGTVDGRSLEADDVDGICTSYPSNRAVTGSSCDPLGGYTDCTGGCSTSTEPRPRTWGGFLALGLLTVALFGRARSRRIA